MNSISISGAEAELLALNHLEAQGLKLIISNFASRFGEIDLVMSDQSVIVFVEVRYRKYSTYGSPVATVDRRKQRKLILAAQWFLQKKRWSNRAARFDVVGISSHNNGGQLEYNWCKNAFGA